MHIKIIDAKNFSITTPNTIDYNVDDIHSQIYVLSERVGQITSNCAEALKAQVADILAEIDRLKALLAQAEEAGADTLTDTPAIDVAPLLASIDTLKADAGAVASPKAMPAEVAALG